MGGIFLFALPFLSFIHSFFLSFFWTFWCLFLCQVDLYPQFGSTKKWDTCAGHAIVVAGGGEVLESSFDLEEKFILFLDDVIIIIFTIRCPYECNAQIIRIQEFDSTSSDSTNTNQSNTNSSNNNNNIMYDTTTPLNDSFLVYGGRRQQHNSQQSQQHSQQSQESQQAQEEAASKPQLQHISIRWLFNHPQLLSTALNLFALWLLK